MVEKLIKCKRCKGEGTVRKYIINECLDCIIEVISAFLSTLLFFPQYCIFYGIFGCFLGPIYFILLKTTLPFYIFGNIFFIFGGICFWFTIYFMFFKDKKINIILIYIISIIICIINLILGNYLFYKKGGFFVLINMLCASVQGGAIGLVCSYKYFSKEMLEEGNNRIKCPLCGGNKHFSKYQIEKMERCKFCTKNCGYENPVENIIFQKRQFCKKCNGKGYFFKDN